MEKNYATVWKVDEVKETGSEIIEHEEDQGDSKIVLVKKQQSVFSKPMISKHPLMYNFRETILNQDQFDLKNQSKLKNYCGLWHILELLQWPEDKFSKIG